MTSMRFKFTIVLIALLISLTSSAAVISVPGDYSSIQAAIDRASPGDVIEVESGLYRENVDVNKPLTLRGVGIPTVDAGGKGSAITLSADGITLYGFVATNSSSSRSGVGIKVISNDNIIEGNNASGNNDTGILLYYSNNDTIERNNATGNNEYGIRLERSSNNTMRDNMMSGNRYNFGADSYNDIDTSNLVDGKPIHYLVNVSDKIIDSHSDAGVVYCIGCVNITVRGLVLKNNSYGISFNKTCNSRIENNNVSDNNDGIYLWESSNNTIVGNIAKDNNLGIGLDWDSSNNTMRENLMSDNRFNFRSYGYNEIDKSNLVDGKLVYYLVGVSDKVVDSSSNAGVVYCIDCENITVKCLTLKNNRHGIYFDKTCNSKIQNNIATGNTYYGIFLWESSNNSIVGNYAIGNTYYGIYLDHSSNNNTIEDNNACGDNYCGIFLYSSSDNTIVGNNASDNCGYGFRLEESSNNIITGNNASGNSYYGIRLRESNNNTIIMNKLVNNKEHNANDDGINHWDNGTFGNYYSDFNCTDSDGDGICDSVYRIFGGESVDRYPLAKPPT